MPRKDPEAMDAKWDIQQQRDRDFVLLEYAERGTLDQWLAKTSRSGKPWPNRALWMLFKCLVSGLVGIGYPPQKVRKDDPNFDPNNPVQETVPAQGFDVEQTAHFDLDPNNGKWSPTNPEDKKLTISTQFWSRETRNMGTSPFSRYQRSMCPPY